MNNIVINKQFHYLITL